MHILANVAANCRGKQQVKLGKISSKWLPDDFTSH
jgi:hypothetical protein